MTKTDAAFWLGIYAGAVASATGLWALFRELWLERPRITVSPVEAWLVHARKPMTGEEGTLVMKGGETLDALNVPPSARKEVLEVTFRNRGRRDAEIRAVGQARSGGADIFPDLVTKLPFLLPAERSHVLLIGAEGGDYAHGKWPLRRFFIKDGTDRVHPLRERYRQRLERILRLR